MTRNTLTQIQILPIWFYKTAILTVQKVNIHKLIRSNLMQNLMQNSLLKNYIELYIHSLRLVRNILR